MPDYTLDLDGYVLRVDASPATADTTIKNRGIVINQDLSFHAHIKNILSVAFFHLQRIVKLRNMMPLQDAEKLVHAFVTSCLDYCNALFEEAGRCSGQPKVLKITRSQKKHLFAH